MKIKMQRNVPYFTKNKEKRIENYAQHEEDYWFGGNIFFFRVR